MNIIDERGYSVVKSNELIQRTRYDLTVIEQKIVLRLIQMIKPDDKEFQTYYFSIKDFCDLCGFDNRSGGIYTLIKTSLKNLRDKSFWMRQGNKEVLCAWVSKASIEDNSGIVEIRLDEDLKPYLLELQKNFTVYSLYYILAMKSKYAIRLYELLKSYEYKGKFEIDIDELKINLSATTYDRWVDLKRFVIEKSIFEINKYSDLNVRYLFKKKGRMVKYLIFIISHKNPDEKVAALANNDEYFLRINDDE